jgi:Protein of unknown function (DUF3095)
MESKFFYRDMKVLPSFDEATNGEFHSPLPDDWWVVVADVMGSTKAIEAGRYKDVNTVGAATIMAVINVDRSIEIPFVFGGDGATLAIPECMVDGVKAALLGAKSMAKDGFNIDLRVGMIPAKDIYSRDMWLRVGKYQHSENITQTSFSGFGWNWAESAIKGPEFSKLYEVVEDSKIVANADFTGFECRWKPVNARNGMKLAIIVQSTSRDPKDHAEIYHRVLDDMKRIYGEVIHYHPLIESNMGLTFNPKKLLGEAIVKSNNKGFLSVLGFVLKLQFISLIGSLAFRFNLKVKGTRWGGYKKEVVDNADFRKFDGALKMVVDVSVKQALQLGECLDRYHAEGKIVFGLHKSRQAIMTCLVFTPGQDHAHFVDGSDGGYAIAAKGLKTQLAQLKLDRAVA